MSAKGYINQPKVNIPSVYTLVNTLGIVKNINKFDASITLNTLYYNLILLFILKQLISLEE
jgi:hypothetical protein